MALPIGVGCIRCGAVLGAMISPEPRQLGTLAVSFACMPCITAAAEKLGVTTSSDEDWAAIVAELKRSKN